MDFFDGNGCSLVEDLTIKIGDFTFYPLLSTIFFLPWEDLGPVLDDSEDRSVSESKMDGLVVFCRDCDDGPLVFFFWLLSIVML